MKEKNFYRWIYAVSAGLFIVSFLGRHFILSDLSGTAGAALTESFYRFYADRSASYREAFGMFKLSRDEALQALQKEALINDYIVNNSEQCP